MRRRCNGRLWQNDHLRSGVSFRAMAQQRRTTHRKKIVARFGIPFRRSRNRPSACEHGVFRAHMRCVDFRHPAYRFIRLGENETARMHDKRVLRDACGVREQCFRMGRFSFARGAYRHRFRICGRPCGLLRPRVVRTQSVWLPETLCAGRVTRVGQAQYEDGWNTPSSFLSPLSRVP